MSKTLEREERKFLKIIVDAVIIILVVVGIYASFDALVLQNLIREINSGYAFLAVMMAVGCWGVVVFALIGYTYYFYYTIARIKWFKVTKKTQNIKSKQEIKTSQLICPKCGGVMQENALATNIYKKKRALWILAIVVLALYIVVFVAVNKIDLTEGLFWLIAGITILGLLGVHCVPNGSKQEAKVSGS